MNRGFSQQEKENLRESLIDVFVEELHYRKISSINIDHLVKKVGIAKGSFYLFLVPMTSSSLRLLIKFKMK